MRFAYAYIQLTLKFVRRNKAQLTYSLPLLNSIIIGWDLATNIHTLLTPTEFMIPLFISPYVSEQFVVNSRLPPRKVINLYVSFLIRDLKNYVSYDWLRIEKYSFFSSCYHKSMDIFPEMVTYRYRFYDRGNHLTVRSCNSIS